MESTPTRTKDGARDMAQYHKDDVRTQRAIVLFILAEMKYCIETPPKGLLFGGLGFLYIIHVTALQNK